MRYLLRLLTVPFVLLIVCCAIGQNQQKADSLQLILENKSLSDIEKMDALFWLSSYSTSPEDELRYGRRLLELASRNKNIQYTIKANQRIGVARRLQGDLGEALEYLFAGASIATENEGFEHLLADIYSEISTCYTQYNDSENALLYGRKTVSILRQSGKKQELALCLLNLGYDYYTIGKYDSAIYYYNESDPVFKEIGMPIGEAYILGNRALVYWKKGDNTRAKTDLFNAIAMLKPLGDNYGMADYYNQLANIYLEENNQEKAIDFASKGLDIAQEEGMKEQIRDASYLLFELHKRAKQFEKALKYQSLYHEKKDSIQNLETTQKLANLRTLFEVDQKQAEVDLLLEQRKNNRRIMIAGALVLIIVLTLALLIYYYSNAKSKLNKQLEEQKNKLLELNNTKDKFFSIISHDLRGPVSIIDGYINLFRRNYDDISQDEFKEMLNQMGQSAESLTRLLDNLLQWALQQRGHFPYAPEKISARTLLQESLVLFQGMAVSKKIEQALIVEDDLFILADKNSTSTIFRNILNNSHKFTKEEGKITVSAKRDHLNQMVIVKISDNGVGMEKSKVNSLFKLNENISTSGTSGEKGLGLGLQLVHEFIQINQGSIEVFSEVGKGTTFEIKLPLAG